MDAITVAAMRAYHVVYAPHTDIGRSCKRGGLGGGGKILSLSLSLLAFEPPPRSVGRPRTSPPVPSVRIRGVQRLFWRCHTTRSQAGQLGNSVTRGTGA